MKISSISRRQALQQLSTLAAASVLPRSAAALSFQNPAATSPGKTRTVSDPGILINQVGYLPGAAKVASVANLAEGSANPFRVLNASGAEVFTGTLSDAALDSASGDRIAGADFSSVATPGTYRLEAGGMQSDAFVIAPDVYRKALYLSTRAFYGQRCGCAVDLGDGYKHGICHKDGAYHHTSGRDGRAKHLGGWHDAGDYGRYVVNSGISTATLLYAFELYPKTLHDFRLDIPRHKVGEPDILSEVRWNLDWMISLQDDGKHEAANGKPGGVWHKQTSEKFCAFIMPEKDTLTSYIIGSGHEPWKTTSATADLAATAAIAARVYKPFDEHYAKRCLEVARKAWTWAVANPDQTYTNPADVSTGGYDDKDLSDELMWASAELFRTTGEPEFEAQFLKGFAARADELEIGDPGWGNVFALACWAYALADGAKSETKDAIIKATRDAAARLVKTSAANGYANTLTEREYGWGSNGTAANQSIVLLMDDHFAANPKSREVALNNLHYLLGRNCHAVSWVTHVGVRPFMHPHHRPSAADGIAAPWPGLLSGGPNRHPGDEAAKTLPEMPPMRMWLDDERAYSMNEIAINWNAPLVFLLAAANSIS